MILSAFRSSCSTCSRTVPCRNQRSYLKGGEPVSNLEKKKEMAISKRIRKGGSRQGEKTHIPQQGRHKTRVMQTFWHLSHWEQSPAQAAERSSRRLSSCEVVLLLLLLLTAAAAAAVVALVESRTERETRSFNFRPDSSHFCCWASTWVVSEMVALMAAKFCLASSVLLGYHLLTRARKDIVSNAFVGMIGGEKGRGKGKRTGHAHPEEPQHQQPESCEWGNAW